MLITLGPLRVGKACDVEAVSHVKSRYNTTILQVHVFVSSCFVQSTAEQWKIAPCHYNSVIILENSSCNHRAGRWMWRAGRDMGMFKNAMSSKRGICKVATHDQATLASRDSSSISRVF